MAPFINPANFAPGNYIGHAPRINFYFCCIAYTLRLLTYFICGLYNVVSGNHYLQNLPWGRGSIVSSRPISGTLIQFLPTMSWLRISYAWYIHSQFDHGCDLDLRHITKKLLYSTLSCYGGHLCQVLRFNNWSNALQIIIRINF